MTTLRSARLFSHDMMEKEIVLFANKIGFEIVTTTERENPLSVSGVKNCIDRVSFVDKNKAIKSFDRRIKFNLSRGWEYK